MIDTRSILQTASHYDVITFDVFDTLLIRDVREPVDVFRLAYGPAGRYLRSMAEILARHRSSTGEVTLADIDRYCLLSCEREISVEAAVCRADPTMYALFSALKKMGKKLYAISDMYLDSATITALLRKAGYDLPVFVSSAYGCNKRSGDLFRVFMQKTGYSASQILHIGDDRAADVDGARKAGIQSCLIPRTSYQLRYARYRLADHELTAFLDHGVARLQDPVEQLGYEIVGPLVLSFCQWVHSRFLEDGSKRLFFLARDMRFIYDIYRTLYDDPVSYLRVSRRSLRAARRDPAGFCRYLKSEGCFGDVTIVDTGWVGVAQTEIEQYSRKIDPTTDVGGLYMGIKPTYHLRRRSPRSHACFYATPAAQVAATIQSSFLEALIGTNEKQVIDYPNGIPQYDRDEDRDCTNVLKVGARRFIKEWTLIKGNRPIAPKTAKAAFERLFYHPAREDMALLGSLHYEDFKDTAIISFKEGYPYWKHPGQFLADLGDSAWKGGYLRCFGGMYPLLLAAYSIFGTARILAGDVGRYRRGEL